MDRKELADLIFPDVKDASYYEEKYPERDLPEGAQVVRVAPSPTGFIHVGGIFQGLIAKKIAEQTNGVFFVRIEDTDQKRKIENGTEEILNAYKDYDLYPDETVGKGNYGPYIQSERRESISMFLFSRRTRKNQRHSNQSTRKNRILWKMGKM